MIKFLKSLIMKENGELSVSKLLIWITGVLATVSQINSELIAAGITIPPKLVPYIKDATILSGIITGLRLRFNMNSDSITTNVQPPVASPIDLEADHK